MVSSNKAVVSWSSQQTFNGEDAKDAKDYKSEPVKVVVHQSGVVKKNLPQARSFAAVLTTSSSSDIVPDMRKTSMYAALLLVMVSLALAKDKGKETMMRPGPVHLDRDGEKWAEKTLKKLSLEQKIGQMIMIWSKAEFVNVNSPDYLKLRDAMRKYHLGGFGLTVPVQTGLLAKSEPFEAAALINQLQRDSDLPLIFAADFERGLAMRLNGATVFPHAMAFGAAGKPEYARAFGRITAEEARALGVEWNWFPVADVNSNPANPIINTRAFSEDPKQVSDLVAAYIEGARLAGMMTTAKHFPGHGDTATDSHLSLAMVSGDLNRLNTVELVPFKAAIAAGVDSVMVAHVTVPALDPAPNHVASNSRKIVTDLLKVQMDFRGLVVTDALEMNALLRLYSQPGVNPSTRAAVETVKAGNDMIVIPGDLDAAYNGLLNAVRSGEIPEWQIDNSVLKILKAKASVGLNKARLVDLGALPQVIAKPENLAEAQKVADDSVTLVRDNGKLLPLRAEPLQGTIRGASPYTRVVETNNRLVAVIFTDDVRSDWGRMLERQLRQRVPETNIIYVDPNTAAFSADAILATVEKAQMVVAAVYMVPSGGKAIRLGDSITNSVSLADAPGTLLKAILQRAGERTVVVAMGSPYIGTDFPDIQNYLCTFSNASVSEISAARALFGEIPIHGRLPVTIPSMAQRGSGLDRPLQMMEGGLNSHEKRTTAR
jgi:beta-N-acetylhexosaminidase